MKTIVVATDFSATATNAVQYAAALATAVGARLVLFHHFDYPMPATDFQEAYPVIFVDDIEASFERRLESMKTELALTYALEIECVVRALTLSADLEEMYQEWSADLIVMGMQGHNPVINALVGNATAAAIRRGNLPLLVVPQGVVFNPVQKILLPWDDQTSPSPDTLQPLLDLAVAFDAYIEVLTLFDLEKTPALVPNGELSPTKAQLDALLARSRHGYAYENESTVDKGILYEAARSAADLVAMIPHHHSFWSALLNQSDTQRVAATITLPLLVLGERVLPTGEDKVETA